MERHNLETIKKKFKALEKIATEEGQIYTEEPYQA